MQNEEKKVKKGFISNTKSELKKVIWPTGKQTVKGTAVTIGFVLLISVILIVFNFCFDFLCNSAYNAMLGIEDDKAIVVSSGDVSGDENGDVSGELSGEVSGEAVEETVEQ